jgi:hypothetical protein
MEARAWSNGSGTFGIHVGIANRDLHFDRTWNEIEVEIDGRPHRFRLTRGFWNQCPEFRDSGGTAIRDWLRRHHTLTWPRRRPPRFQLLPLGEGRFRLVG